MFKIVIPTILLSAFVLLPLTARPAHSLSNSGSGPVVGGLNAIDDGTGHRRECLGWCEEFYDQSIEMCMLNHPPERPKGFFWCVEYSMNGLNRCNRSCK